jgi:hypothetical protein
MAGDLVSRRRLSHAPNVNAPLSLSALAIVWLAASDCTSRHGARAPQNHRTDDSECEGPPPPPVNCTGRQPYEGDCDADTQCTAGTNGRCAPEPAGTLVCDCAYDFCVHDSECSYGGPCACNRSGQGNSCVKGNCQVDSDCGPSGYCSPTTSTSECSGVLTGYYCHTPNDECVDDADCGAPPANVCVFQNGFWQCAVIETCQ